MIIETLILSKPKEEIVDLLRYHKYLVSYLKSEAKYDDKIWVIQKTLPKQLLIQWAVAVARSVEHIFTEKYPSDKRVTELLDFMESIKSYDNMNSETKAKLLELRNAADAADAAASAANANYAAYYAVYSASNAAYYAADAANAADADVAAYAAYHAANAAAYATHAAKQAGGDAAREKQEELNIELCLRVIGG